MITVGQSERRTQNRVVKFFRRELGYDYLGNWEDRLGNSHIEEKYLCAFLEKQGHPAGLIDKALYELGRAAGDQSKGLYEVNKAVYGLLRYGVQVKPEVGENTRTVELIDWKNPHNNHFAIAEEVTVKGQHDKRPDVVLYINGLALGVLELKRSIVSVEEGIRQNLDNQKKVFIASFFATVQLVMAGSDTEGLRYAPIDTAEKYFLTWKEPGPQENLLDRGLAQLCRKERLLEIIHDFTVFDGGQKKLCRHNQYFGVKAAQEFLRRRQGGIVWHTQGSGKSLTMVWLAHWIRENIPGARVLIITDRTELDEQIERTFTGVGESIDRAKSGAGLLEKLNAAEPWLLCSLIHKFAGREEGDVAGYIEELKRSLPPGFSPKGDIYVMVDECHRTQSGDLHKAMKLLLPDALFLGVTGTPLLKADKKRSIEVFGSYIHTYKYDEAVRDQVVLDLRYEARDIDAHLTSPAKVDQWFAAKTKGLTPIALAQLKQKWGTLQKVYSSASRLSKIVADILLDMAIKDRLESGHGNALLVAGSIYEACKFYQLFLDAGFTRCAIITSYRPAIADIKGEETGEGQTEKLEQYAIYNQMLGGKDVETFEKEVKKKFVEEPAQMKLLIVVDKLLTGFDAPPATYLYIDKPMQDHGLFQAICRVNRLDGEDKEYGYIIDYKDLFKSLETSIHDYTSGAFDGYDKADVEGLLTDRLGKAKEHLEERREAIKALCEPAPAPKTSLDYQHYFCGAGTADPDALAEHEARRLSLYRHTASLVRAYAALANEMGEAGYTPSQIETIQAEVALYEKLRMEIKIASGDYIDLKTYEPAMRHLLDTYIQADESQKVSALDDFTLVQLIVERGAGALDVLPAGIAGNPTAVAETIENNLRRLIIDEHPINPRYYDEMSTLLDAIIKERREKAKEYQQYLQEIIELTKKVHNPSGGLRYPKSLNTPARRALYDNLDRNEELAAEIDALVQTTRQDDWRGNRVKEKEIRYAIRRRLGDEDLTTSVFELVKQQEEY